jgi:rRNA maturation RNase YbeY
MRPTLYSLPGRHIQSLNKQWRSEDKPTDVLSFPQEWIEGIPEVLLGDVVISLETAAKQAKERNYALLDELRVLLVGQDS